MSTIRASSQVFLLHRFISLVATTHGVSIFADDDLKRLEIELESGQTYDRHFEYRPLSVDYSEKEQF